MVDTLFIGLSLARSCSWWLSVFTISSTYGAMGVINMAHGEMVRSAPIPPFSSGIYQPISCGDADRLAISAALASD